MSGDRFGHGTVPAHFDYKYVLPPKRNLYYESWGKNPEGKMLYGWLDQDSGEWYDDDIYGENLPRRSQLYYGASFQKDWDDAIESGKTTRRKDDFAKYFDYLIGDKRERIPQDMFWVSGNPKPQNIASYK
tara:strand:+ start:507 stop:896 length:390 start_codon:yes stop_codon:yes gene_type:complete